MDCDACKNKITAISEVAQSQDAIDTALDFFKGPDYCDAEVSKNVMLIVRSKFAKCELFMRFWIVLGF